VIEDEERWDGNRSNAVPLMNESNVIDVHIALLRHKMEAGGLPRLVQTFRGVGYSLRE
jgi:DNA-binding response OmpR family regulator